MSDLKILRASDGGDGGGFSFWCAGCKRAHRIPTSGPNAWGFNGDLQKPTFTPSILVTHPMWHPPVTPENMAQWRQQPWEQKQIETRCHSFVTEGSIQFLSDCTHELAGQTVPLEPF